MELESFEISVLLSASPEQLYRAWLDGEQHGAFTGAKAEVDARVGGKFTAWDGYLWGHTLELEPDKRIVQSWRTAEFAEDAPDSQIEVRFEAVEGGTKLALRHTGLQPGDGEKYEQGWQASYFAPMLEYFGKG
jgi:uncharacterized protein YndB with AHSA1/START domain